MDLEALEALALSPDRSQAINALLPGSPDRDYWQCIVWQNALALDAVDATLATWEQRHGPRAETQRLTLARRQLALRAGLDLQSHREALAREAGARLDHVTPAKAGTAALATALSPAICQLDSLLEEGLTRDPELRAFSDWMLPILMARAAKLSATSRRALLKRLRVSGDPALVWALASDFALAPVPAFGDYTIHRALSLAQLYALAQARPELRAAQSWVQAVLDRLGPSVDEDPSDDRVLGAWLDRVHAFVDTLSPAFNSLRAQVLAQYLSRDLRAGRCDRRTLLRWLALPRQASFVNAMRYRETPSTQFVVEGAPAIFVEAIDADRLVRACLSILLTSDPRDDFEGLLHADWLAVFRASHQVCAGDVDPVWVATLGPGRLMALRDEVRIAWSERNPARVGANDPVSLSVRLKNIASLVVKVFAVDEVAHFLARGVVVDASIDLDGMVARHERILAFSHDPLREHTLTLELPECAAPGTYVIDLMGAGLASRAVVRKGALTVVQHLDGERSVLSLLDDTGARLLGGVAWIRGRAHPADALGLIEVPLSAGDDTRVTALVMAGTLVQSTELWLKSERYTLCLGAEVLRESLVAGLEAAVVLNVALCGPHGPVSLRELGEAFCTIRATKRDGVSVVKREAIRLEDTRDAVLRFDAIEELSGLEIELEGEVSLVHRVGKCAVRSNVSVSLADMAPNRHSQGVHLQSTWDGYALCVLGAAGEALAGRIVELELGFRGVSFVRTATLQSDPDGLVTLGALEGVESLKVTLADGYVRSFAFAPIERWPSNVQVREGQDVLLPLPDRVAYDELQARLTLVAMRDNVVLEDHTGSVEVIADALRLRGLRPGFYRLTGGGDASEVRVRVVPKDYRDEGALSVGSVGLATLPAVPPFLRGVVSETHTLRVRVEGATERSRVHVIATRFVPERLLARSVNKPAKLLADVLRRRRTEYVSGRNLGDEIRYVIERRGARKRPGSLLERPSLLMHPWARRATHSAVQTAMLGQSFGAPSPSPSAPSPKSYAGSRAEPASASSSISPVEFLDSAARVLENLRPDANGEVLIALDGLGHAQHVLVLLSDPGASDQLEVSLASSERSHRDLRLARSLDPTCNHAEIRRLQCAATHATLVLENRRTGRIELIDSVPQAWSLMAALDAGCAPSELAFVARWNTLSQTQKCAHYGESACHELNLFLQRKDRDFFDLVVAPSLRDKRHQAFIDRYLLGEDLTGYLSPWAFGRLDALERALLAQAVPAAREAIVSWMEGVLAQTHRDRWAERKLLDAVLGSGALGGGGGVSAMIATMDAMEFERGDSPAPQSRASRTRLHEVAEAPAEAAAVRDHATGIDGFGGAPGGASGRRGGGPGAPQAFLPVEKTQEWAEARWWRCALGGHSPVAPSRFWRDVAAHREGAFLSTALGECARSVREALCALALTDLPFVAGQHGVTSAGANVSLVLASPAIAATVEMVTVPSSNPEVLVGQSYVRADDRYTYDDEGQRDKIVQGPLVPGVAYLWLVAMSNPSAVTQHVSVLMQCPQGAMPIDGGRATRTEALTLGAYESTMLELAFYFPEPGEWTHLGAQIARESVLLGSAPSQTLTVREPADVVDLASWKSVSRDASLDDLVRYLSTVNMATVALGDLAYRMRDRDAYERVLGALESRLVYDNTLWAYAILHADRPRASVWLAHQAHFVGQLGPWLHGGLVDYDAFAHGALEHLEYAPLVHSRAHRLGARLRVLNDGLSAQYQSFLRWLAHVPVPSSDALLAAVHYLFALDRVDEALAVLTRVRDEEVTCGTQLGYLRAYAALCEGAFDRARAHAAPHALHPIDRWRRRFESLLATLDEAQRGPIQTQAQPDDRARLMSEAASREPSLSLAVEAQSLVFLHKNITHCAVNFYAMDVELLFSRSPFAEREVDRFSWIEPTHTLTLALDPSGRTVMPMPAFAKSTDAVISAVASTVRASLVHYAHEMSVTLALALGQLRVSIKGTGDALPTAYIKVFARNRDGSVSFFKDGYTDWCGRFDFATVSNDALSRVQRFAILVHSEGHGATVLEADPPTL